MIAEAAQKPQFLGVYHSKSFCLSLSAFRTDSGCAKAFSNQSSPIFLSVVS